MMDRRRLCRSLLLGLPVGVLAACGLASPTPTAVPAPSETATSPVAATPGATPTAGIAPTASPPPRRGGPRQRLWLMTGGTGSAEELFGRGIAQSINDRFDGYEASVEVTSGATMNLAFLLRRQADLALVTVDAAATASEENAGATPPPIRQLINLFSNYLHLVVPADSPARGLSDLRGRRVAIGPPDSPTQTLSRRVLAGAGLTPDADLPAVALGPSEAARALQERQIEALFWLGPAPAAFLRPASQRGPALRWLPLDEAGAQLSARYPDLYRVSPWPADAYPGLPGTTSTVTVDTVLVTSPAVSETIAYGVTRATFDNIGELPFFHPEGRRLTLLTAVQPTPLPLHPGALRFYREKGVLG